MILGAFVTRTVRRRRQRNAAALTALTTGDYGRTTVPRGKFDKLPASKPVVWETRVTSMDDEAKGWASIFVSLLSHPSPLALDYQPHTEVRYGQPVAGATVVPVTNTPEHDVNFQRLASWRSRVRFSPHRNHRPIVADPSPIVPSMEPPASSPAPMHLTFLISMPTPMTRTKVGQENGGPPVVELGVAQVSYVTP
jgi:hypothetical protein